MRVSFSVVHFIGLGVGYSKESDGDRCFGFLLPFCGITLTFKSTGKDPTDSEGK